MNAGVTSLTAIMAKSDLNSDAYVAEHGEAAYVAAGGGILYTLVSRRLFSLLLVSVRWQIRPKPSSIWFQVGMFSWGLGFSCAEWILCTFKVLKQLVIDSVWYDLVAPYDWLQ
jgi:hypothetical protein